MGSPGENHPTDETMSLIFFKKTDGWGRLPIHGGMSTYSSVPYFSAYHIFLSLGDLRYKRFGITSEPEVRSKLLEGNSFGHQI